MNYSLKLIKLNYKIIMYKIVKFHVNNQYGYQDFYLIKQLMKLK